jgi:hypothetical protein
VFGTFCLRDAFLLGIVSACTSANDPYFCLLQADCIEMLDHFVVDVILRYSVYLSEVEENKQISDACHWFALVYRKLFVAINP